MSLNYVDKFILNFNPTELKQLELIRKKYKFKTINETLSKIDSISDFSFLEAATVSNYYPNDLHNYPNDYHFSESTLELSNNLERNTYVTFNTNTRFKKVNPHKHNFIEISYIMSGECTQEINGTKIHLKKGDIIILDTNVSHSIEFTKKNDLMINFLLFKDYFNSTFFKNLNSNSLISTFLLNALNEKKSTNDYIIFHTKDSEVVKDLINKIIFELTNINIGSKSIVDCCFIILFTELLRIYDIEEDDLEYISDESSGYKLNTILHYIDDNYKDITLGSVAEHFHFSSKYFSAMIKKATGKNFTDLILEQKLINSCLLLKNTTMSIEDISKHTGFSNKYFFYKKFKEYYLMTPKEYRQDTTIL